MNAQTETQPSPSPRDRAIAFRLRTIEQQERTAARARGDENFTTEEIRESCREIIAHNRREIATLKKLPADASMAVVCKAMGVQS